MIKTTRVLKSQRRNSNCNKEIRKKELQTLVVSATQGTSPLKNTFEIKSGRFNTIYQIENNNSDYRILRIAPSTSLEVYAHESCLLKRELSVYAFLPLITEHVPKVIFADFTKKTINRDYIILSFIDGQIWESMQIKLSKQQNINLWIQLIRIIEMINKVEDKKYGFPSPLKRYVSWKSALVNILGKMIQDLRKYSLEINGPEELLGLINRDNNYLFEISKAKLTHGDLWPKNVLIKKSASGVKIVGIIDWERAFWGDPRAEWILPGKRFAGQKAKRANIFRCGLFSADYDEIPKVIGDKYKCKNVGEFFREQVYLGIFLTQRKLEAQRYPRSEPWIEEEFRTVISNLKNLR